MGQTGQEEREETLPGGSKGASSGGDIEFWREEDFLEAEAVDVLNCREEGADPGGKELERGGLRLPGVGVGRKGALKVVEDWVQAQATSEDWVSGSRPRPAALWLCLACSWDPVVRNALEKRGPPSFLLWLLRLDDRPGYGQLRPKQTLIRGRPRTTDSEAVSGARVDLRAPAPQLCEQDPGVSHRDLSLSGHPQSTSHCLQVTPSILLGTQPSSPRGLVPSAARLHPAVALGRRAALPQSARPNPSPCLHSLLQLVISGPVQQSPHTALPPGFYPHIHTPPLGYGAVPAHPAAHPALPTHPGHTFISGMTFPFRPIH